MWQPVLKQCTSWGEILYFVLYSSFACVFFEVLNHVFKEGLLMQVYERVAAHAQAGHFMGGSCFWCLTGADYPDYDGFKISLGRQSAHKPAAAYSKQKQPASSAANLPLIGSNSFERQARRMQQKEDSAPQPSSSPALAGDASNSSGTCKNIHAEHDIQSDRVPARYPNSSHHRSSETVQGSLVSQGGANKADAELAGFQKGSSSLALRRVSTRTESNVEAAAAIFDGEDAQSELQAAHLGAETMYLITEHAAAMHALNQQAAGRDCCIM